MVTQYMPYNMDNITLKYGDAAAYVSYMYVS